MEPDTKGGSGNARGVGDSVSSRTLDKCILIGLLTLMPFTVVTIDEQQLVSAGFSKLIEETSEFKVVACFHNHHEALSRLEQLKPDLVLCDFHAEFRLAEDIISDISNYSRIFNFVAISGRAELVEVLLCLEAGVRAFLVKNQPCEELIYALKRVAAGGVYYCPQAQLLQLQSYDRSSSQPFGLTSREKEVLQLLCQDRSPKEIAHTLHVDRKTVDTHKRNLYSKLGIHTTIQLVKFGLRHHLIEA